MAARLTLKAVNDELTKRGHRARLEKASGYFYFLGGEATDWIDRTVSVPNISTLELDQWMGEFLRLKALNEQLLGRLSQSDRTTGRRKRV